MGTNGGVELSVRAMFTDIDDSGNGQIAKAEFIQGICNHFEHTDYQIDAESLGKIFDYIDIDQSGHVTLIELAAALEELHEPVWPAGFKRLEDKQGVSSDGRLDHS